MEHNGAWFIFCSTTCKFRWKSLDVLNNRHISCDSDVSVPSLETKKVAFLDEVTSAQYDNSPYWLKNQVSMQVMPQL